MTLMKLCQKEEEDTKPDMDRFWLDGEVLLDDVVIGAP